MDGDLDLLQSLLDSAFQGLMALRPVLGPDGTAVDLVWTVVNAGAEHLLGRPRSTLIGNSFQPTAATWPVADVEQRLLRVVDTGTPDAFDLVLRVEGRPRVCSVKVTPFAAGLAIYVQDVTDRRADEVRMRELEQRARRAEQRLIDALEASPDPFAVFDADERLALCNQTWAAMSGLGDAQRLPGRRFEDLLRQASIGADPANVGFDSIEAFIEWRLARHRNPDGDPIQITQKDGRVFLIRERRMGDGGTVNVATEVTELERSRRLLRDTLDATEQAVALFDPDDRLVVWNQAYERFSPSVEFRAGLSLRSIIETVIAGNDAELLHNGEPITVDQRLAVRGPDPVELERRTPDGRIAAIRDRRTADGGTVVTSTDVTDLKRKEQMLEAQVQELDASRADAERHADHLARMTEMLTQEKERAEAASRTKSQFLANMSHELRTPLNAVLGFSEILKTEAFGPLGAKRYKDYADDIHASGSHLLSLINDLLDMSKIEAGKYRLHKETVAMAQIVGEVGRMMRGRAAEADLVLQVDPLDAGLAVAVDIRAIKQVLINLLANAITYTPAGGRVRLGVRVEPEHVAIQVADNGIGIPKDELPRLLRPFEQIDRNDRRGREGTGLGLALSNALVELHEGSLTLDSEPGVGTTVTVRLPL
ncbi:MAG: PAS-domain containing protein [Thalassobaculum sp.]|uniref:sensor histidine kinase n=1 Tax=Thalassobaculum sp. TaxID=2022740 RepID=UPI0032EE795A